MELCQNTIWEPKSPEMEWVPALLPVPSASHESSGAHIPPTAAPQNEVNRNPLHLAAPRSCQLVSAVAS